MTNQARRMDLGPQAEREIIELEEFLQSWISGRLDKSVGTFDRFASVLAPGFHIVPPVGMGEELDRSGLIKYMMWQHGTDQTTTRWVENVVIGYVDDSTIVVVYDECQVRGGVRLNSRVSATFIAADGAPNGLAWVHIHETALPDSRN